MKSNVILRSRYERFAPEAGVRVKSVVAPEQLRGCVLLLSEPREPEIAIAGTASQRLLANHPHRVALNVSTPVLRRHDRVADR